MGGQLTARREVKALYGGSFDPPHLGHLLALEQAALNTGISQISLMPCAQSPLKNTPGATQQQRLAMLELLCAYAKQECKVSLAIEPIELSLPSPSYTVKTLTAIRQKIGRKKPICFFLGEDSVITLPLWREWENLLRLCHLIIMPRFNTPTVLEGPHVSIARNWIRAHQTRTEQTLHHLPCGSIYQLKGDVFNVASTDIRQAIQQGLSLDKLLPESIANYIHQQQLYQH